MTPTAHAITYSVSALLIKGVRTQNTPCVGIEQLSGQALPLTLYPNPAADYVIAKSSKSIREMHIMDVPGNIVYKPNLTYSGGKIPLGTFSNGIYFIQFFRGGRRCQF